MGLGGNNVCNSTLDDQRIGDSEDPIAGNLTFHDLGQILAAVFACIGIVVSCYNILMHAWHFTKPKEQKNIIRILFMVPVFCVSCFLQFRYYWNAVYFQVIAEAYESIALASFFSLISHYIAPNLHDQKEYFRYLTGIKGWIWPVKNWKKFTGGEKGPFRTPRSGLTWFNIVYCGVYQYCFTMIFLAIVSILCEAANRYCASSERPVFFHLWDTIFKTISVITAMLSIIQSYVQLKPVLQPYSIITKIVAIKLVIFLSFWQNFFLNILTSESVNVIKPTSTLAYADIRVGIPNLLLCIEMAIFSVFHLWAFTYKPYVPGSPHNAAKYPIPDGATFTGPEYNEIADQNLGGFLGLRAFAQAANISDLLGSVGRAIRWIFVGRKKRHTDVSYNLPKEDVNNPSSQDVSLQNTTTAYASNNARPPQQQIQRPDTDGEHLITHAAPNPGYTANFSHPNAAYSQNQSHAAAQSPETPQSPPYPTSGQGQWVTQEDVRRQQEQTGRY